MSEFLRGNCRLPRAKKSKQEPAKREEEDAIAEELRERALASVSGSMVYYEYREHLGAVGAIEDCFLRVRFSRVRI